MTLLRILIDRVLELQDSAVITFLDLTNAFGSASRAGLCTNPEVVGICNAIDLVGTTSVIHVCHPI